VTYEPDPDLAEWVAKREAMAEALELGTVSTAQTSVGKLRVRLSNDHIIKGRGTLQVSADGGVLWSLKGLFRQEADAARWNQLLFFGRTSVRILMLLYAIPSLTPTPDQVALHWKSQDWDSIELRIQSGLLKRGGEWRYVWGLFDVAWAVQTEVFDQLGEALAQP
jgi:hypothetical protein